jgi:hypothetical protein
MRNIKNNSPLFLTCCWEKRTNNSLFYSAFLFYFILRKQFVGLLTLTMTFWNNSTKWHTLSLAAQLSSMWALTDRRYCLINSIISRPLAIYPWSTCANMCTNNYKPLYAREKQGQKIYLTLNISKQVPTFVHVMVSLKVVIPCGFMSWWTKDRKCIWPWIFQNRSVRSCHDVNFSLKLIDSKQAKPISRCEA